MSRTSPTISDLDHAHAQHLNRVEVSRKLKGRPLYGVATVLEWSSSEKSIQTTDNADTYLVVVQ